MAVERSRPPAHRTFSQEGNHASLNTGFRVSHREPFNLDSPREIIESELEDKIQLRVLAPLLSDVRDLLLLEPIRFSRAIPGKAKIEICNRVVAAEFEELAERQETLLTIFRAAFQAIQIKENIRLRHLRGGMQSPISVKSVPSSQ